MSRTLRLIAVLAVGIFVGSASAATTASAPAHAETTAQSVIRITNEHRAVNGRKALKTEWSLNNTAQTWANHMSSTGRMEHSTNDWRASRVAKGASLCCGENIAYGYTSPGAVVKAWMKSTGHRANILDSRYTHMGVGYNPKGHFWVQIFAAYPAVSVTVPQLSGMSHVGYILDARVSGFAPAGAALSWQWYADGVAISGARGSRHLVLESQVGKRLTVRVTANFGGTSVSKTSSPTPVIKR
ncbi:CAP domain-containing protein [Labedella phragmitis]|uniref:CAP domain-containing protein n=1 Tax=Labedella phragmitis TaxID=2498849 RepID=A0A3S4AE83_9MICO|nr:CAP domain-containing protein [Labedella phragmitis]RWZ46354.1 CAP domain-containing protein [Labedella phragmitis]